MRSRSGCAGLVREQQRVDDVVLGDLGGAALDHHDRVAGARRRPGRGRDFSRSANVGLTTNSPSTRPTRTPASGPAHGMSRDVQRARAPVIASTSDGFSLSDESDGRDDLRVDAPALGEQRARRAIDEAAGQDLVLGRAAFALEVAARDLAGGGRLLEVLEVSGMKSMPGGARRCATAVTSTMRVAVADDDRAVGLLGHLAGLDASAPCRRT